MTVSNISSVWYAASKVNFKMTREQRDSALTILDQAVRQDEKGLSGRIASRLCRGFTVLSGNASEEQFYLQILTTLLANSPQSLSPSDIVNFMMSTRNLAVTDDEAFLGFLQQISLHLDSNPASSLGTKRATRILYCMGRLNSNHREVRELIVVLTEKLTAVEDSWFSPEHISGALYGMRGLSCYYEEVGQLLACLTAKAKACSRPFGGVEIGRAMYGLQLMRSTSPDVLQLLTFFKDQLAIISPNNLRGQSISNILYGMQAMDSKHTEVREFITVLANKISASGSAVQLSMQEISAALYGLNNFRSHFPEVKLLLSALNIKIQQCTQPFNSQAIGNCLYGLKRMRSQEAQVAAVVATLSEKLSRQRWRLSGYSISNALYGLGNMSDEQPEVRAFLSELGAAAARNPETTLSLRGLNLALYGLRNMTSAHYEVRAILAMLTEKLLLIPDSEFRKHRSMSALFAGLQFMSSDDQEVRNFLVVLNARVRQSQLRITPDMLGSSMRGLSSMSSEHEDVRAVLRTLLARARATPEKEEEEKKKKKEIKEEEEVVVEDEEEEKDNEVNDYDNHDDKGWTAHAVYNTLRGMRNMSCQHVEVVEMLCFVRDTMRQNKDQSNCWGLTEEQLQKSLQALESMRKNAAVPVVESMASLPADTDDCCDRDEDGVESSHVVGGGFTGRNLEVDALIDELKSMLHRRLAPSSGNVAQPE